MSRLKFKRWQFFLFIFIIVILVSFGFFNFGTTKNQIKSSPVNIVKTPVIQAQSEPDLAYNSQHDQQPTKSTPSPIAETTQLAVQTQPQTTETAAPDAKAKIFYKNKVAVITYHHLDAKESSVTITPERFKSHMNVLKSNGFNVISVEDFIAFLQKKKSVPANAVVITFDDGYESVYKYAYPILKSEGMVATTFLIVSYVDDGTIRQPSIMNWKQINEMHNDGFSFYSHSYNSHGALLTKGKELSLLSNKMFMQAVNRLETDNEYKTRVREDLTKADDILNTKLSNKINLLCLPHGQYNPTLVNIANQSHITYLFTGTEGLNTDEMKLINRINAGSPYMSEKLLLRKLSFSK